MTEIDGMIEKVGRDIRPMLGQLPTASTREQVRLLEMIAVTAEYVSKEIGKMLEFERTLDVFNQHGAEADSPFGAMPFKGQVMVFGYRASSGVMWNGVISTDTFTREAARIQPKEVKK